jgi:subtilisin family serine protease
MSSRVLRSVIVVALLLSAGWSTGAGAADPPAGPSLERSPDAVERTGAVAGDKAPSSRLAETDRALLGRADATPTRVMIKLDYDSVAAYGGDVKGLAATSPSVTGRPLSRSGAERAYEAHLARVERDIVGRMVARVPQLDVRRSFRLVYGGVSAVVPANQISALLEVDGVVAVQENAMRELLTDASPEFIGAPTIYSQLGGDATAGAGVVYGNLDSGIWPEHPSFADLGTLASPPPPARECNYGDNPLTLPSDPFVCQDKLIGGAHFSDDYDDFVGDDPFAGTARDADGHGTHTSSTSAGNIVASAPVYGVDRGPIQGLAPGAWVMEYKVCGPQGCFSSDSTAAIEQAIVDGVDVINFSISGGTDPFADPVELAFLDAYAAGVFVAASSGNEGPGAGTANHLSPWVTTVGASTQTREFATTLTLEATGGDTFVVDGASITDGVASAPVVLASSAPYSDAECETAPPSTTTFAGMIVACQRGGNARVEKGFNVMAGGAVGMILYNPTLQDVETDTHWLPTVHLADGADFLAFMGGHTGVTGSFPDAEKRDGQGDVMAAFSSRGPGGLFIKPDITAPGVQILAGDTPYVLAPVSGPGGELFQAVAGTSMSSPHIAGSAILLAALHPTWTPGQIRSALMTTATTDVVKEDLTTPADPFDMGSGRVDLNVAGAPQLTFDETAADFFALGADPVNAVHLNVPSVNAPVMPGELVTTRVATNVSGATQRYTASTEGARGAISVSPKRFTLAAGESITLTIRLTGSRAGQHVGSVRLTPDAGPPLHLPVAFVRQQGSVTLMEACTPTNITVGDTSECMITAQNNAFAPATVDLRAEANKRLTIAGVDAGTIVKPRVATLSDVVLAGAQPGVPSVDPGELFGYLPLDEFEVTPDPVGDEDVINYSVPPFVFNGKTYNAIGVDSNGYLVAGGATAEDNKCCDLPSGPDPSRPNNVLAPFWTDLNGTGTEGIFVAVLADGPDAWIVVEWRVNVFGTTDERRFQTWIGINGVQDITYAYSEAQTDPNGQDFLVGAENELGQGDMTAVLPTADLRVTSTDPVPGDSVVWTVTVEGVAPGIGKLNASMTADIVPGITMVGDQVRVTGPS